MTIETLFGTEKITSKPRTIRFKQIKAIYETLTVSDQVSTYFSTKTRYTAPSQVYEAFRFLMMETKEIFLTLHLDGKNRIQCIDQVSIGSLNQSIVQAMSLFGSTAKGAGPHGTLTIPLSATEVEKAPAVQYINTISLCRQ